MKIGIDIDGVLADFCSAYEALHVEVTGRNTFAPYAPETGPVAWNWPQVYGYSAEETKEVWRRIKESGSFNQTLLLLPDAEKLSLWMLKTDEMEHDVYFVTARVGQTAKYQTQEWLYYLIGYTPTVLIASDKAAIAGALNLDIYIDDNWHNAERTGQLCRTTQVFLIDRAYNRPETSLRIPGDKGSIPDNINSDLGRPYRRIKSLIEALPK